MRACVVIPVYKPFEALSKNRQAGLRQTLRVLRGKPFCFIGAPSLNFNSFLAVAAAENASASTRTFDEHHFKNVAGYSKLLLSPKFYKSFLDYEFILICQDDVWIFRDELDMWCDKGYDYIGAPWFEGWGKQHSSPYIIGVGNGGFSLRRVRSHLKVLSSFSYVTPPGNLWGQLKSKPGNVLVKIFRMIGQLTVRNNTFFALNNYSGNEDGFWGETARRNFEWFKVGSDEDALAFCMEVYPRLSYDMNKGKLPFAVHAWERYEPDFWKQFIPIE